jgi:hypothetical protein
MKRKKILQSAILMVILAFIGLCLYMSIRFSIERRPIGEIDDISRYAEIRNQYQGIMQHFPEPLPADATEVKFHYHPSFMQGGTVIQLRLQLPKNQVEKLTDEYYQTATLILHNGNVVKGGSDEGGIPHPQIWVQEDTKGFEKGSFTFFLHEEPLGEENFLWNHGTTYGVMINQEEQVVIYWAEEW